MMKLNRRAVLGAGAALAAGAGAAQAQAIRWQMATAYTDGNFHTVNNRAFIRDVEQATGGRLSIQMHSGASLLKMGEIKRGLQTGQVQLGEVLISVYGNEDPFFEVDGIPQLVTSTGQARTLAELSRPYIQARLEKQGLVMLYWVIWPPSGFYTNEPLTDLAQLKGQKFRSYNIMTERFAQLVGAAPTLLQSAEVAQAFATGVVNAMVTSAQSGADSQVWDYIKYYTPIGFIRTKNIVMTSRRALNALPEDIRAKLLDAAKVAEARGWEASIGITAPTEKLLADHGMIIEQPSKKLLGQMDAISRVMVDEWVAKAGPDGKKLIDAYRAATGT